MKVTPLKNDVIDEKELDKIVRQRMEEGKKKMGHMPLGNYGIYDDYNWMRNSVLCELKEKQQAKLGIAMTPQIDCIAQAWIDAKISAAKIWLVTALVISFFIRGGHLLFPLEVWAYYQYKKHITKEAIDGTKNR